MNVVDNQFTHVHLKDLAGGELFEYDAELFMRVVVPSSLSETMDGRPTCVNLQTGRLAKIGWGAYVIPVEADLVVKNRGVT